MRVTGWRYSAAAPINPVGTRTGAALTTWSSTEAVTSVSFCSCARAQVISSSASYSHRRRCVMICETNVVSEGTDDGSRLEKAASGQVGLRLWHGDGGVVAGDRDAPQGCRVSASRNCCKHKLPEFWYKGFRPVGGIQRRQV